MGMVLEIDVNGMGKRFTNRTQSEYLNEYWLADSAVKRYFARGIKLELGLGNILDTGYEETNGYAGRSRSLRLTIEYTGD